MSKNLHSPTSYSSALEVRELVFVGFDGTFHRNIFNFPYDDASYDCTIINNPFKVLAHLKELVKSVETYRPPYAVLFRLDWLLSDNFQLIQQMNDDPDLRYIPVIALSENAESFEHKVLISKGIDDCYTIPINWEILEKRIQFLQQFKPRLLEQAQRVRPENFNIPIPFTKRALDIIGSLFLIIVTAPIWIPTAIAIAVEDGFPVIYRSKRAGRGYQVIEFLKFRSMYRDADQRLKELQHLNQYDSKDGKAVFQKISNDPRVIRVGKFIRKYSIDELPQFFNILRGDMSLVGNRPLPLYEAEQLTNDEWSTRFLAPAGLTGLWQVTKRGRSDMSIEERISLDIEYAKNYSVWTDIKILFKTFTAFVQKEDV